MKANPIVQSVILLLLSSLASRSNCQPVQADRSLTGTVIDSLTNKPVDLLTLHLKSTDKAVTTQIIITKEDGSFNFDRLRVGQYTLSLSGIGYALKSVAINIADNSEKVDVGKILLRPVEMQLNAVTITGNKPLIRREPDRIVYDLEADPESKSRSLLEMMRKVPLLTVNGNDQILLKGSGEYRILIDGKPSATMAGNASDILKTIPASTMRSIEVITSPSAKYDAEGAGLINIVTNKQKSAGYNGSVNANGQFPSGGPGAGGSITLKSGKLGISANSGIRRSLAPQTHGTLSRLKEGPNSSSLLQEYYGRSDGRNNYFITEISLEADSLNLLSATVNYNRNAFTRRTGQLSTFNEVNGSQSYELDTRTKGAGHGMDASFNYQLGFKSNKARLLTFSYRHYNYGNSRFANSAVLNPVNFSDHDFRQQNEGWSSENTVQADYVYPLKTLTFETGVKAIIRANKSDFQYLERDGLTGIYTADPAQTNRFTNRQRILGAYANTQVTIKKFNIRAGARIEKTAVSADFISTASVISQDYFNVIPSISINTKLNAVKTLTLSFSQRIQRPGIYQLNPFVDRTNPHLELSGNPALKPSLMNDVSLMYSSSGKASLNIMLGYSSFARLITRQYNLNVSTGILRSLPENIGRAQLFNSNLYLNYPFTPTLGFSVNTGLAHGSLSTLNDKNVPVKNRGFVYNGTASGNYKFANGLRLNTDVTFTGRSLDIQETSVAFTTLSLGLNKEVIKDKFSFSASLNNPFSKYRTNHTDTFGPDFSQSNDNLIYFRSFNTSLNYRFGKLKEGIKKNRRGIRNDDVSTAQ